MTAESFENNTYPQFQVHAAPNEGIPMGDAGKLQGVMFSGVHVVTEEDYFFPGDVL